MYSKVYIAGPMTGRPQFNFPAFDRAAKVLRGEGKIVVSPAELDSPAHRKAALASEDGDPSTYNAATGDTWGKLLSRDVEIIADHGIEAIIVLPGWEHSRGARLETYIGYAMCGRPVVEYGSRRTVPFNELVRAWAGRPLPDPIEEHAHVVVR